MAQALAPENTPSLATVLVSEFEADLRHVADLFDQSFWPPEPLDEEFEALLRMLASEAAEAGADTRGFVEICSRFDLEINT